LQQFSQISLNNILNSDLFSELNYIDQLFAYQPSVSQQISGLIQSSTKVNTPIQDIYSIDEQSSSSEGEDFILDPPRKRHRGGPKRDQVWEYVNVGVSLGDGHYKADCKYCGCEWTRGRPQILKRHLARECLMVPQEVKEIWQDNLAIEEKSVKRKCKMKTSESSPPSNVSDNPDSITESRQQQIDRFILKA